MFFLMMIIMFFCGGMCAATSPCGGIISEGEDVLVDDTAEGQAPSCKRRKLEESWMCAEETTDQEDEGEGSQCRTVVNNLMRETVLQSINTLTDDAKREEVKKAAMLFVNNILLPLGKGILTLKVKQKLEAQFNEISKKIGALEGLQPPEVLKMPACRQSCYIKRILVKLQDVEESILVFPGGRFATCRTSILVFSGGRFATSRTWFLIDRLEEELDKHDCAEV